MIIRKADKETEAGVLPSTELLAAMMKYHVELMKAGEKRHNRPQVWFEGDIRTPAAYPTSFFTTFPSTSVSRKSRPR